MPLGLATGEMRLMLLLSLFNRYRYSSTPLFVDHGFTVNAALVDASTDQIVNETIGFQLELNFYDENGKKEGQLVRCFLLLR